MGGRKRRRGHDRKERDRERLSLSTLRLPNPPAFEDHFAMRISINCLATLSYDKDMSRRRVQFPKEFESL